MELTVIALGLVVLIAFGIAAGRYTAGSSRVDAAAAAAARAASIQRDAVSASEAAQTQAELSLMLAGLTCQGMTVTVETAAFGLPAGQRGTVSATVSCTVDWSDLSVPGLPGAITLTSTAASPLDTTQER